MSSTSIEVEKQRKYVDCTDIAVLVVLQPFLDSLDSDLGGGLVRITICSCNRTSTRMSASSRCMHIGSPPEGTYRRRSLCSETLSHHRHSQGATLDIESSMMRADERMLRLGRSYKLVRRCGRRTWLAAEIISRAEQSVVWLRCDIMIALTSNPGVTLASPVSHPRSGRQALRSSGPAARWIAPSTPPPPNKLLLAALTIMSTYMACLNEPRTRDYPFAS